MANPFAYRLHRQVEGYLGSSNHGTQKNNKTICIAEDSPNFWGELHALSQTYVMLIKFLCSFLVEIPQTHTKKCQINKLGQCQSPTPFSSLFFVQKDFGYKKLLGPKNDSSKNFLIPTKFWVKKNVLEGVQKKGT